MKIFYSPQYDGEIFLGDQPKCFDELYVGNMGLLQQLGLRSGIPIAPASDMEREVAYQKAMKDLVQGTCFEKTFTIDPFGVAAKLLLWRDMLIMAGWDGTCTDDNLPKLHVLAKIEKEFRQSDSYMGIADYWQKICQYYEKNNNSANQISEIQIDCPQSEVPYLVQRTLAALKEPNWPATAPVDLQTSKIKVVQFADLQKAHEWITQVTLPDNSVIINRDNVRLTHMLYVWDKPVVHASLSQSNPQLLQLFKLSLSVFSRPLNLGNLISYLQLPNSPIPGGLRYKLSHILLKNGGFGEVKIQEDGTPCDEWDYAIRTYEFKSYDENGKPNAGDDRKVRAAKMPFLDPIRQDLSKGITQKELCDYTDKVQKWALGFLKPDDKKKKSTTAENAETKENKQLMTEEGKKQLRELSAMFSAFKKALENLPDPVSYSDIEKIVLRIYRPMSYTWQQSEQRCLNVINDLHCMAVPADTLVWLDCQAEDTEYDPYDFLSTAERQYLTKHNGHIPDFATHLKARRNERNRLLNSVGKQVVLVQSEYDGVQRLSEHSLVAEVKRLCDTSFQYANAQTIFTFTKPATITKNIDTFDSQMYYEMGNLSAFNGREESNSSIDTLIQRPFNYVMQYVAELPTPSDEQLQSPQTTLGLVAHHFFQHVIDDGKKAASGSKPYDCLRNLTNNHFEKYLNDAINATGLILLADENATQLYNFRWQLKESMLSLIDIMEYLGLQPEGCEIKIPDKGNSLCLPTIGDFGARIDFLLTDASGNYVVFDFKWSFSNWYAKKLEENTSIQLELYRQSVTDFYKKTVVGVGYFMMPQQKLFTTDFAEWSNKIVHVDATATATSLFQQIQNSFEFRKAELENGHIEEGELMDLAGCNYENAAASSNLFTLEKEKDKKASEKIFRASKKKNDFSKKEPNEIPTSHPILKGRLK